MTPRTGAVQTWRLVVDFWPITLTCIAMIASAATWGAAKSHMVDHTEIRVDSLYADRDAAKVAMIVQRQESRTVSRALCTLVTNPVIRDELNCPKDLHP